MMDAWGKERKKSPLCFLHEKDHTPQRQICLTNKLQIIATFFFFKSVFKDKYNAKNN